MTNEVYIEEELDTDAFMLDADEFEKTGLWEPSCYHFRIEEITELRDEEFGEQGDYAGQKYNALNLRWAAFERAIYNDEGYATGEIEELKPVQTRFQKCYISGPFKKKGLEKLKSLCNAAIDGGIKTFRSPEGYDLQRLANELKKAEVWNTVGMFQNDRDEWVDYMSPYYTKKPARKIRR